MYSALSILTPLPLFLPLFFLIIVSPLILFFLSNLSWTVARQALLSMKFSRQEYWSGLPFPLLGDLPGRGIEPASPGLAGWLFTTESAGNLHMPKFSGKLDSAFSWPRLWIPWSRPPPEGGQTVSPAGHHVGLSAADPGWSCVFPRSVFLFQGPFCSHKYVKHSALMESETQHK